MRRKSAATKASKCFIGVGRGNPEIQLETTLAEKSWEAVREGVKVELLDKEGELYVLALSRPRLNKERAMRRRALRKLLKRDELLLKLSKVQKVFTHCAFSNYGEIPWKSPG